MCWGAKNVGIGTRPISAELNTAAGNDGVVFTSNRKAYFRPEFKSKLDCYKIRE